MRTWKNLWPQITSYENLLVAAQRAEKGKRSRENVAAFNVEREKWVLELRDELLSRTYMPGPYRQFTVYEYKPRLISAAPYRDRVIHHAFCNVVEPLFERTFIHDSYACRKGKGTHAAADRYTQFSRKNRYVLKCDISKYFNSIDHAHLYARFAEKIRDEDTLWLLRTILATQGDAGLLWPAGRGIPIGNLTSQFFANVYLNNFDHWMKQTMKCRYYIRYVDDFVVLENDKQRLQDLIPRIENSLGQVGLRLHPRKRKVFPVAEGCDFMGYRIWRSHRRIRPVNGYRFRRRLKTMARDYRHGSIGLEDVRASVASWIGHAAHADTWGLRRAVFGHVTFSREALGRSSAATIRRSQFGWQTYAR